MKAIKILLSRFSKIIIVTLLLTVFAFIITVFVFTWNEKAVPDSLIYSFFGMVTGEFGALGLVKTAEKKYGANEPGGE